MCQEKFLQGWKVKITFNVKFFQNFIQIKSIKWLSHRCYSKKFGTIDCRSVSNHLGQNTYFEYISL